MAHSEKVRTGHERWNAQWLYAYACTLRTSQSRADLGAWPVTFDARDRLKRYRGAEGAEAPKAPKGERRRREDRGAEDTGAWGAGRPSAG